MNTKKYQEKQNKKMVLAFGTPRRLSKKLVTTGEGRSARAGAQSKNVQGPVTFHKGMGIKYE